MKGQSINRFRTPARDILGPVYFAALSVAIWGPALFANGYVLLGDMVFTPAMHPPASLAGPVTGTLNITLLYNLAWVFSRAIGAVLLQKLVFGIGFLPGYLLYRNTPSQSRWGRFFGGTLYQVNPYVYTRMLMGQWGLLLGYALLPVAVFSTLKTAREPSAGRCARTALWLAAICLFSLPMGGIALLACLVAGILEVAKRPDAGKAGLALCVVLALFALVSAFWLVPAFRGTEATASIGKADVQVFSTRSTSRAGTWISVLGLYGYWKVGLDPLLPRGYVPLWPVLALGLTALALFGFWSSRREPEWSRETYALLIIGVLGFFLSLGASAPLIGRLFNSLYYHVSFFRLFREPQKFAALLALSYACLGGLALDRFAARQKRRRTPARSWRGRLPPVVLIALVCFYSFRIFGGLWGQAKAVSYPRSWSQASELLERDRGDWSTLYLPPYWYMTFDFAGQDQAITAPMPFYFTNNYVQLNALQVGPVKIDRQPIDIYMQSALETAREQRNLGAMLAPLNIKYVLMPLNDASVRYRFVMEQKDLEVVRRWSDLVLLRNRVPTARLIRVSRAGSWKNLEQLGLAAEGARLTGSYLPRGEETVVPDAAGVPLPHKDLAGGGVQAEVRGASPGRQWALFGQPYDGRWRLDGRETRMQAAVSCAFELPRRPGTLKITYHDPLVVAGYTISGAGLLLCLVLLISGRRGPGRGKRKDDRPA